MRKAAFFLLLTLMLTGNAVFAQSVKEKQRNIILVGWDAVGRKNIKEELTKGAIPNLKKLSSEGALVAIDVLRRTDTKAGWAQILTGYEPEVTGVFKNDMYGPIPKGYSIFERLKEFFGWSNFITVAVIGKKEHMECDPPERELIEIKRTLQKSPTIDTTQEVIVKNGKSYWVHYKPAQPYYYTKDGCDLFLNDLGPDEKVGGKALALIEKYKDKPFFFFIHFQSSDNAGHKFKEGSNQYYTTIESQDFWLGEIIKKLKELGIYNKTLIYVTADHGFDIGKRDHFDAPYIFLATNDRLVMRNGERVDITPTLLDRFGMDLESIKPPLDGHPLTKSYKKPIW